VILVNNNFLDKKDFSVDIEDRAYQFGDGIYEVIRVYGGRLFAMDGHFDRLWRSCAAISITLPYEREDLAARFEELVKVNRLDGDGIIYLQISRGVAARAHQFPDGASPLLVAYTREVQRPLQYMEKGGSVVTVEDIRWLRCDIKSLNLLGNVLAKQSAVERGALEAVMHRDGVITEGSASNFFIVKEGALYTHPLNNLILGGITRNLVVELARELGIALHQQSFTVEQAYAADEAFITSTISEVLPVTGIDGRPVGSGAPGPVTRSLQEAFGKMAGL
jgi:D-alanine transaminase